MTYSRNGLWIVRSAVLLLSVVWIGFVLAIRPSRDLLPWVGGAFAVVCFALAFRAYFYLDEIQRTARMRAWYYGAPLGILTACIAIMCITARPDLLDSAVNWMFGHRSSQPPSIYFVAGVTFTILAQGAGNFVARASMALLNRNP